MPDLALVSFFQDHRSEYLSGFWVTVRIVGISFAVAMVVGTLIAALTIKSLLNVVGDGLLGGSGRSHTSSFDIELDNTASHRDTVYRAIQCIERGKR